MVSRADSGVTIHTASYDGRGRRLKKVALHTRQYTGTVVFYRNRWKILETGPVMRGACLCGACASRWHLHVSRSYQYERLIRGMRCIEYGRMSVGIRWWPLNWWLSPISLPISLN